MGAKGKKVGVEGERVRFSQEGKAAFVRLILDEVIPRLPNDSIRSCSTSLKLHPASLNKFTNIETLGKTITIATLSRIAGVLNLPLTDLIVLCRYGTFPNPKTRKTIQEYLGRLSEAEQEEIKRVLFAEAVQEIEQEVRQTDTGAL